MISLVAAVSGVLALFGFGTYRNVIGIFATAIFLWCIIIKLFWSLT